MDWLFLALSASVVWIASLCKVLYVSNFPSKVQYFNSGDSMRKRTVLFVIAHPDDESMFFTPAINYLTTRGHNVHIFFFSTGNADGMGDIRKDELYKACTMLKVPLKQVAILDHPELQDGFGKAWNHTLIAKTVEDSITSNGIDLVITFDSYGVSGHCNHRDVHFGIRIVSIFCASIVDLSIFGYPSLWPGFTLIGNCSVYSMSTLLKAFKQWQST